MKRIESIDIVLFPGFYNTMFEWDDYALYMDLRSQGLEETDGWDVDYSAYEKFVTGEVAKVFGEMLENHLGLNAKFEAEVIDSPREYNFRNDDIYTDMVVEDWEGFKSRVLELMKMHETKLSAMIHRNHTSRDGFISFMSNKFKDWVEFISEESEEKKWELYLAHALTYLLYATVSEPIMELYYDVIERVNIYDYAYPSTEAAKKEWDAYYEDLGYPEGDLVLVAD